MIIVFTSGAYSDYRIREVLEVEDGFSIEDAYKKFFDEFNFPDKKDKKYKPDNPAVWILPQYYDDLRAAQQRVEDKFIDEDDCNSTYIYPFTDHLFLKWFKQAYKWSAVGKEKLIISHIDAEDR